VARHSGVHVQGAPVSKQPPKHKRRGRGANREGELKLAKKRLEDSIDDLVHHRRYTMRLDGGKLKRVRLPSLYQQVVEAVESHRAGGGGKWAGQFPFWADALVLLGEIDAEVMRMHSAPHSWKGWTVPRLTAVSQHGWRPQDCKLMLTYSAKLDAFSSRAEGLFSPKPIALSHECPECGERWVYRDQDGEEIRMAALQITENGATCGNSECRANWPVERLPLLGKILGYGGEEEGAS
jgi:hypothetical protein